MRVLMSAFGPSRHFAAAQQLGRFGREADIKWQARSVGSIANDPQRTCAGPIHATSGDQPAWFHNLDG